MVQKAFKQNLKPIVIINKVERPSARPIEVYNEVFELFCDLSISEEFLDYPVYFASGREGWAVENTDKLMQKLKGENTENTSVECILEGIVKHFQAPNFDPLGSFKMLISQTASN